MRKTTTRNRILAFVLTFAMVFQQAGITTFADDAATAAATETTVEASETGSEGTAAISADETTEQTTAVTEETTAEITAETTAAEATEAEAQTTAETDAQDETAITEASTENTADPAGETADTGDETEEVTESGTEAAAEENTEVAAEDVTEAESDTEEAADSQTDAESTSEEESEMSTEADIEIETESESETEASTEDESEAPKTEFEYEDERVIITAIAAEEANLPQDAELKADYIEPDSDEYKEAVAAFNEQLSEELNATDDTVVVEYTLYDIYFVSASTDERIEPDEGKVTVTMTFVEPVAAEAEGEVISTEVVHLKNDGEAEIVTDYVDTNSDGEVTSVGFTQDSFSIDGTANVISLTAANNSVTYLDSYVTNVDYSNATYSDDTFTSSFKINFSGLLVKDIQAAEYTYYYAMPSELDMPPIGYTEGSSLKGRLTDGTLAFTYSFVEIDGKWYIEIVFDQAYIASLTSTSTLTDGYIEFRTYIESSAVQQDGSLKIPFSVEVTINAGDITTSSNETWQTDISVSKSSSGYNVATGSITYTVTVSSVKGTDGDITLNDLVSLVSNSGLSFSSVIIDSVVLKKNDTVTNNNVSYTENSSSDTLSITLEELGTNSSYVITYTVYLDASSTELDTYVKNTVTASADDNLKGEISTSQTQTTYVKTSLLSKSGSVTNSSTGEVTWTITVNPYGADVAGYVLEDAAFAGLSASDFTISGGAAGTDYEFVYASDNTITGIKFLGNSNTNTYTITYKTYEEITWGGSNTVTNEAGFSGGEASATATGYPSNGSLSKSVEKISEDTTNDTITLSWTVTAEIPAGGIETGTELLDCLGTYDKDFSGYTSLSNHWFTYEQINTLLSQYSSSITLNLSDGNTKTITSSAYTLYAYDKTCGAWVAYSELSSHDSCKFTAFEVVFNSAIDLDCSGTWLITYTTTGDTSELVDSLTYYNSVQVGNLSTSASYKEEGKVVKTDGNGATGSSSINLDETGTVTWIVKLYIPEGATTTYTVTDTLPKGITFDTAVVNASGATGTLVSDSSMSTTMSNSASLTGTTATDTDSNTIVTIKITPEVYANLVANGGYLTITYNCKLEDIGSIVSSTSAGYTTVIGSYKNSVIVTASDGSTYGSADQTQVLSYHNEEEVVTLEEVNKSYNWDNLNGELSYTVLLNPDAETLNNGDDMTFTDKLVAATWGDEGNFASLIQSSVKFYKLIKITDTEEYNYTAADGTKYYKEEVGISWTYEMSSDTGGVSGTAHIITATVPDSTAILVEYTYNFNIVGTIHSSLKINGLTNTASLSGTDTYEDTNSVNSDYEESYFNAGISS